MNSKMKRWLPIAICCLPGVLMVTIVGISLAVGGATFGAFTSGPIGLGLIAVAVLACPLSMALMMRHKSNQKPASGGSQTMADCCRPSEPDVTKGVDSAVKRLAVLRQRRKALERELVELQPK